MSTAPDRPVLPASAGLILIAAIFLLAICGLVYELIAGTLSSYLLGDTVTQFSLVIGLFLTAMGLGSFLSKYITRGLLAWFVAMEIAVGLIGGSTALVGLIAFAYTELYQPVLLGSLTIVGVLVGLEIPLVIRVLRELASLRVTLANVLSADYLGALAASVLFPFALLPHLGLVRAGLIVGLVNVLVAGLVLWRIGPTNILARRTLGGIAAVAVLSLTTGVAVAGRLVTHLETRLYQDEIIYATTTPFQRIVLTRWKDDVRLFLNGHLQFSSVDEYRYHEALVHPAMGAAARRERVLILGGGDGLAARQVLKYPDVARVDVVDVDAVVTRLFASKPLLTPLNANALNDVRVRTHNVDAMRFLEGTTALYDVVLMDLPDPSSAEIGKLYSVAFFGLVGRHLAEGGVLASQCTSPFRSRAAFWCIVHTVESVRWGLDDRESFDVYPYHTVVPTFGTWGFVLASTSGAAPSDVKLTVPTRYLTDALLPALFVFPPDMAEVDTPVSRLDDPAVTRLYREGYHKYLE